MLNLANIVIYICTDSNHCIPEQCLLAYELYLLTFSLTPRQFILPLYSSVMS